MRSFVVLITLGAAMAALGMVACGDNNKPPLTPDTEHPSLDAVEAGAPAPPSSAAPAK